MWRLSLAWGQGSPGACRSGWLAPQRQGGVDALLLLGGEKLLAQLLQCGAFALLAARLVVLVKPLLPVLFFPVELGHGVGGGLAGLRTAGRGAGGGGGDNREHQPPVTI